MQLTEKVQASFVLMRLPYILALDFLCLLFIVTFQKGFHSPRLVGIALITVALIIAGGAAINDYFDSESDALTHPERPIPSKNITPARAAEFAALTLLAGLAISFAINPVAFGIVALDVVLFILYPRVLKRLSGFLSNLVMGYLGATIALFAGAVVFQTINADSISFVGLIAGSAIGLNVLKDILTLDGDLKIGYPTLAARHGVREAAIVGALFLLLSAISSPTPLIVGVVGIAYLFPIVVWAGVVGATALPLLRAPNSENVRGRLRTFTRWFPYAVGLAGVAYVLPFVIRGAS